MKRWNSVVMQSRILLVCTFFCISVFYRVSAFAVDNLYLCGIVKEVDTKKAVTSVDVQSKSCPGLHRFSLSEAGMMSSLSVDQRICFYIDSNQCKDDALYNITKVDYSLQQVGGGFSAGHEGTSLKTH